MHTNSLRVIAIVVAILGTSKLDAQTNRGAPRSKAHYPPAASAPSGLSSLVTLTSPMSLQDPVPLAEGKSPSDVVKGESEAKEDSLEPPLSKIFSSDVTAANTSVDGIGTGVLPEPATKGIDRGKFILPDGVSRGAVFKCAKWQPSLICHQPLYYQEVMLERHGHDRWGLLQPLVSGVRFYSTIGFIPYLTVLRPPCENYYVLGHYRAGTCAPALREHLPWDKRAAAVQTLSAATFFWAAPL